MYAHPYVLGKYYCTYYESGNRVSRVNGVRQRVREREREIKATRMAHGKRECTVGKNDTKSRKNNCFINLFSPCRIDVGKN